MRWQPEKHLLRWAMAAQVAFKLPHYRHSYSAEVWMPKFKHCPHCPFILWHVQTSALYFGIQTLAACQCLNGHAVLCIGFYAPTFIEVYLLYKCYGCISDLKNFYRILGCSLSYLYLQKRLIKSESVIWCLFPRRRMF